MEAGGRQVDWKYWRHVELSWRLGPEERQWLRGTCDVAVSRGIGFALAVVVAINVVGRDFLPGGVIYDVDVARGLVFLSLGILVLMGKRWASLGLMAFYTSDVVISNILAYNNGWSLFGISYRDHPALRVGLGLLALAICMRVYYVAFRAEQRWAAGLDVPAVGKN